jgi:hypothetical protein
MTDSDHDIVTVHSGPLVTVELYQQALAEAGIESKVVGLSLTASFGTALADSVELWVKSEDAARAAEVIERYEAEREPAPENEQVPRAKSPHHSRDLPLYP